MQLNEARIAELLKPFLADNAPTPDSLSADQLKYISMYIDILLHWNERINLTAVREPEEIVTRHFGESHGISFPPPMILWERVSM
jgi:16S rRNA (guanine527-N7)-methyltransferase